MSETETVRNLSTRLRRRPMPLSDPDLWRNPITVGEDPLLRLLQAGIK